jgi:hypothetical protein
MYGKYEVAGDPFGPPAEFARDAKLTHASTVKPVVEIVVSRAVTLAA